jgi:hypothetical protein
VSMAFAKAEAVSRKIPLCNTSHFQGTMN